MATKKRRSPRPTGMPNGRPPADQTIDLQKVEQLASMFLTGKEIAAVLGINEATLYRNATIASVLEKGREAGKASLKRAMFVAATHGKNVTAQIWLSKNVLGWTDRVQQENTNLVMVGTMDGLDLMTPEQRREKMRALATELIKSGALELSEGETK